MAVNFNLDLLYKLYRHDSLNGGTSGSIIDAENFNKNAFVINGNQITVKEADGDVFTYDLNLLSQGETIFTEALSSNDPIGQITKPKTTENTTAPVGAQSEDTTTPTTPVSPTGETTGNEGDKKTTKTKEQIQAELDALKERREKLEAEIKENRGKIEDYKDKIDALYKEIEATIGEYIDQAEDIADEIKEQVKQVVEKEIEKYKNGEYDSTKSLHNAIAADLQGLLSGNAMQNLTDELQRVLGDKKAEIEPYIAEIETIEGETEVIENEVENITEEEAQLETELEDAPETPPVETPKEPQGFAIKGEDGSVQQFDFFVDRDGNGGLTDASEFLGAQGFEAGGKEGAWAEMTNLDTNGDGVVDVGELDAGNVKIVKTTVDANGNKVQEAMSASDAFGKNADLKINTTQNATTSASDTPMNFNQFANNELLGNFDVTLNGQTYTGYQTADSMDYLNANYDFTSGSAEGAAAANGTGSGKAIRNLFKEEFKYDIDSVVNNVDKSESESDLMKYAEDICNKNGIFFNNGDKNNNVVNNMINEMLELQEKEKHIEFAA